MKRWVRVGRFVPVVFVAVVALLALSGTGFAADKIGVIDLSVIVDESKAGKEANAVLTQFIRERQQLVQQMEDSLQQLSDAIEADDGSSSDEQLRQMRSELDEGMEQYFEKVNQFEQEIEELLQRLRAHVLSEIRRVLPIVAEARGFDIILDASSAHYYRRTVDLTFEVIREYDELWEAAQAGADE